MKIARTLIVLLLVSAPMLVSGQDAEGGLDRSVAWNDVTTVRLDVTFPGDGYNARWLLNRCECGDLLIESELHLPGDTEKGELLLVGQRAVLERGFRSKELESQMSWDAPALMMQLTAYLLNRAVPAGPSAVTERVMVKVDEPEAAISLDSGNAVGGFPAPWTVKAVAEPHDLTHRRFDLKFDFSVPGQAEMAQMRLKGVGNYERRDFPLQDDMSLDGWHLSWRSENDPASLEPGIETLADLRAAIARNPQ